MKDNKTGKICSTNGRDEKCMQNFGLKNSKEREQLEDQGVDGKITL